AGAEVCACADPISSAGPTAPATTSAGIPAGGAAGGGPGVGFGPTATQGFYAMCSQASSASRSASARRSASAPDSATEAEAAAAGAAAQEPGRARRRRQRIQQRGFGDEFMTIGVTPDWAQPPGAAAASDRGAGPLGFAGTAADSGRRAAGITVLTGDGLDTAPRMPMLPGSWDED
ncbi:MAG: PPE family protein, partial [Mycobacterium sp.]